MSATRREVTIWATFLLAFPLAMQVTAWAASGEGDRQTRPFVDHVAPASPGPEIDAAP